MYIRIQLLAFFLIYAFLGWVIEVVIMSLKTKKFCNRGFLNAPLCLTYGMIFAIEILVYPTLKSSLLLQMIVTLVFTSVIEYLAGGLARRIVGKSLWKYERHNIFSGEKRSVLYAFGLTGVVLITMNLIQPLLYVLVSLIPIFILQIILFVIAILLFADFLSIVVVVKKRKLQKEIDSYKETAQKRKRNFGIKISNFMWNRMKKAYPLLEEEEETSYTFAKGMCLDKLLWIFIICALLGDLIETVYCRFSMGFWMSRSSVVYGPFSIVWGLAAVILTIVLQKIAHKEDRYIFFAGFFLGGSYEYICSVFLEVFFGTKFWDYSHIPLNIGGRTNLLFCLFWGVLAVVWIKFCYPCLSMLVEKIPAFTGKVITWSFILFMVCDMVLSAAVMVRYTERQKGAVQQNGMEEFLDEEYPNSFVERIWPNMKIE